MVQLRPSSKITSRPSARCCAIIGYREVGKADAVKGRAQRQLEIIDGQRAFDGKFGTLTALVENLGLDRSVPRRAEPDAVLAMQIPRKRPCWLARESFREVGGT